MTGGVAVEHRQGLPVCVWGGLTPVEGWGGGGGAWKGGWVLALVRRGGGRDGGEVKGGLRWGRKGVWVDWHCCKVGVMGKGWWRDGGGLEGMVVKGWRRWRRNVPAVVEGWRRQVCVVVEGWGRDVCVVEVGWRRDALW